MEVQLAHMQHRTGLAQKPAYHFIELVMQLQWYSVTMSVKLLPDQTEMLQNPQLPPILSRGWPEAPPSNPLCLNPSHKSVMSKVL